MTYNLELDNLRILRELPDNSTLEILCTSMLDCPCPGCVEFWDRINNSKRKSKKQH